METEGRAHKRQHGTGGSRARAGQDKDGNGHKDSPAKRHKKGSAEVMEMHRMPVEENEAGTQEGTSIRKRRMRKGKAQSRGHQVAKDEEEQRENALDEEGDGRDTDNSTSIRSQNGNLVEEESEVGMDSTAVGKGTFDEEEVEGMDAETEEAQAASTNGSHMDDGSESGNGATKSHSDTAR